MCRSAVRSLIPSRRPICRLVIPAAASSATCRSRVVSAVAGPAGWAGGQLRTSLTVSGSAAATICAARAVPSSWRLWLSAWLTAQSR